MIPEQYQKMIQRRLRKAGDLADEIYEIITEVGFDTIDFSTKKVLIFIGGHKAVDTLKKLKNLKEIKEREDGESRRHPSPGDRYGEHGRQGSEGGGQEAPPQNITYSPTSPQDRGIHNSGIKAFFKKIFR